jgi:alpha-L-fucosidase 2
LPDAWPTGEVKGICARGGFEIAMKWVNKSIVKTTLSSKNGGTTTLIYRGVTKQITLRPNEIKAIEW